MSIAKVSYANTVLSVISSKYEHQSCYYPLLLIPKFNMISDHIQYTIKLISRRFKLTLSLIELSKFDFSPLTLCSIKYCTFLLPSTNISYNNLTLDLFLNIKLYHLCKEQVVEKLKLTLLSMVPPCYHIFRKRLGDESIVDRIVTLSSAGGWTEGRGQQVSQLLSQTALEVKTAIINRSRDPSSASRGNEQHQIRRRWDAKQMGIAAWPRAPECWVLPDVTDQNKHF